MEPWVKDRIAKYLASRLTGVYGVALSSCCGSSWGVDGVQLPVGVCHDLTTTPKFGTQAVTDNLAGFDVVSVSVEIESGKYLNLKYTKATPDTDYTAGYADGLVARGWTGLLAFTEVKDIVHVGLHTSFYYVTGDQYPLPKLTWDDKIVQINQHYTKADYFSVFADLLKGKTIVVIYRDDDLKLGKKLNPPGPYNQANDSFREFLSGINHEVLLEDAFTNRIYYSKSNYLTLGVYKFHD